MPPHSLFASEHSSIRSVAGIGASSPEKGVTYLDDRLFTALKQLVGLPEAEGVLSFFYQKGLETIRTGSYAGLIGLPGGAALEILPRFSTIDPASSDPAPARQALLRMLRHLPGSPFRTLTEAHLGATQMPIWNVFVQAFLDALSAVSRQGLQTAYQSVEANQSVMRGQFQPARNLRQNLAHAERLAIRYDTLSLDIPPNRILKTALVHVLPRVGAGVLETRLYQMLAVLHDVPPSANLNTDLRAVRSLNRLFDRYALALQWAELLLTGRAFGPRSGQVSALSLLFPMQRVFEEYVAHGFRAFWPAGEVSTQESSAHLVEEHGGTPKFRLRPDVLIRQPGRTLVFDTKWKRIDGQNRQGQYGIDSGDLYQLFAYGKKYEANDVFLIYPATPTFTTPLDVFGYDPAMRLHVLPFDVSQPLRQEVEKLYNYVSP
ncbi:restriction endonuclease [Rudanella paleaurantiibacter]|uniref:Restriction endonuclease n=1 Tax=Rudanella paleaurantiibacter TaxID=2614655 RepID=A0A7J5U2Z4_9BACT|nr:McrC family protein [Rudanella paleaurantiibacter]KAB7732173.1 restriction endonuclease [Rudanella paleaurantiibacter]